MDKREAVSTLRAIAAVADKLARDVESNRLWEGEYATAVGQLTRYVRDLPGEN